MHFPWISLVSTLHSRRTSIAVQPNLSTALPYHCLVNSLPTLADPAEYVTQLKATMPTVRAPPVCKQSPKRHVSNDLSCTHVYIRHDGTRKPLQRPYDGPYKVYVLKRHDKHFTVEVKCRQDSVSLDHLKPVHL